MAGSPKKRARRLGIDPLDEPAYGQSVAEPRPALKLEPHNKARLSEANRERVMQAMLDGYPLAAIARALSVTVPTLKRLIAEDPELEAQVEAQRSFEEAELRDILMELARKGDTVAAIFLAKARHGWRDRDDAKVKVQGATGGVLLLPASVPLDEWEAAAAAQQAPHRERNPETDPFAPKAAELGREAQKGRPRTRTRGVDGLSVERTLPGDLPH